MRFHENTTDIILKLRDRRGHEVRASRCHDLKLKVWTQDPESYLTFHLRDVHQGPHEDVLSIPDYEMEALMPGVVLYSYTFESEHGRVSGMEVTDIKWRGARHDGRPGNPVNYQTIEKIKDTIADVEHRLTQRIKNLYDYLTGDVGGSIQGEADRATQAESDIIESLGNLLTALGNETTRAMETEKTISESVTAIAGGLQELRGQCESFLNSYGQDRESAEKQVKAIQDYIKDLKKRVNSVVSGLDKELSERIDKVEEKTVKVYKTLSSDLSTAVNTLEQRFDAELTRLSGLIANQGAAIEAETTRAKGEEARIETKVKDSEERLDAVKDVLRRVSSAVTVQGTELTGIKSTLEAESGRARNAEALISDNVEANKQKIIDETERARLVERDLAESLQKLKQSILSGNEGLKADLEYMKSELHDLVDYRIKEVVGAAPEALDTLEEIAAKLKADDDIFKALQDILEEKAGKEDVYTRVEIDRKLGEINNAISAEVLRAGSEEAQLKAAIDIINGDDNTVGSIRHALADARHYTEDAIKRLQADLEVTITALKGDLNLQLGTMAATVNEALSTAQDAVAKAQEASSSAQAAGDAALGAVQTADAMKAEVEGKLAEIDQKLADIDNIIEGAQGYEEVEPGTIKDWFKRNA